MGLKQRAKLAVLISGRGSNMAAILEASHAPDYPAEISLVISDKEDADGLNTALDHDIPAYAIHRNEFSNKLEHEAAIRSIIDDAEVDLICLAGFMRILSTAFVNAYKGRLINIHPSLLPNYKGLDTHARAIKAGDKEHGCTVHFVNAEMDGGQIIEQATVPIAANDTTETLAAKVLIEEHKLYPKVIADLCVASSK